MNKYRLKAQSFLEYSMLVFCLCLALVAMSSYIRRAVTGGLRENIVDFSQPFAPNSASSLVTVRDSGMQISGNVLSSYDFDNNGTITQDEVASIGVTEIPEHNPAQRRVARAGVGSQFETYSGPLEDD